MTGWISKDNYPAVISVSLIVLHVFLNAAHPPILVNRDISSSAHFPQSFSFAHLWVTLIFLTFLFCFWGAFLSLLRPPSWHTEYLPCRLKYGEKFNVVFHFGGPPLCLVLIWLPLGVLSSMFHVLCKSDPAQSDVQMMDMQRNQTWIQLKAHRKPANY